MIEARSLTKRYGSTVAVDDLSFTVPAGAVTGFLGPNGAGKTTTLRMLLGLVRPTSGDATIGGERYVRLPRPAARVGAVLEASAFHPGRSGRNHLRTVATAADIPERRVDEVLDVVELTAVARRRVKTYSLGMRQRLAIAQALLGDPDVLLLDEPANGLDPQGIRWLRDFLRSYAADGRTVFVSSHVLAEIAQTVDSVAIINRGKLVAHESLMEVRARAVAGVRVRSPQAARLREALAAAGIETTDVGEGRLVARIESSERVGEIAAANGVVLHELTAESSSLEDVFLELTGESRPQ
ncbi:MAG TPA: ABC transporter ATP-binding protein [Gaiellaceae bacterium]|nr:ABC transporter ATP-binding protein [Gaiellaceae bacterium]